MKITNPTHHETSLACAIGQQIKQVRGALNQHDFAVLLDVTKGTVNQLEQGKRMPTVEFLSKIKQVMDVDMNLFFTGFTSKQETNSND